MPALCPARRTRARHLWRAVLALCVTHGMALAVAAEPYRPARDDEVVEVLRGKVEGAEERRWRALRDAARARPQDLGLALEVARQALGRARRDGDTRWLGQVQAALRPWWTQTPPPDEVQLLRATVSQSLHAFDAAKADLQALLQRRPDMAQAWLLLASIEGVRGHLEAAQAACARVRAAGAEWHGRVCEQEMAGIGPVPDAARQAQVAKALDALASQATVAQLPAVRIVQAELAARRGEAAAAHIYYQDLLTLGPDAYALASYADFLLEQGHADAVIELLQPHQRNDGLLLRLALAYRLKHAPAERAAVKALQARFAAGRERGDRVHLREEARFTLHLLNQPERALSLAQANWRVQKEHADARVLLEAAQACGRQDLIAEVTEFMVQTGWRDARLKGWL